MITILVLCTGNSARSQMAEAYLRHYAPDEVEVFSAGIHEKGINPFTIMALAEDNLDASDQLSKSYKVFKNKKFDYLITVCNEAWKELPKSIRKKHHLHFDIPDPDQFEGVPEEKLEYFKIIRDWIKKEMLLFIGEELTPAHNAATFA